MALRELGNPTSYRGIHEVVAAFKAAETKRGIVAAFEDALVGALAVSADDVTVRIYFGEIDTPENMSRS